MPTTCTIHVARELDAELARFRRDELSSLVSSDAEPTGRTVAIHVEALSEGVAPDKRSRVFPATTSQLEHVLGNAVYLYVVQEIPGTGLHLVAWDDVKIRKRGDSGSLQHLPQRDNWRGKSDAAYISSSSLQTARPFMERI